MKFKYIYMLALGFATFFIACKKEERPVATDNLNIPQMFGPAADADPLVKSLFNQYGLWIRMDFKDVKEVTNAILYSDVNNRFGATKIDNDKRSEAITFTQTLLSNVSEKFSKSFFPLEFFYVKTYNGSWWATDLQTIGRSRIVITWPNKMFGALPVVDPATHYYRDSVLTRAIWSSLGTTITPKITIPIEGFELAGKAYDNGVAVDRITDDYYKDYDLQKRDASYLELASSGGFITAQGSRSFDADFPQWLALLSTESEINIKKNYLDNSPRRARKYEVLIKFFNSYGWDIQATGNLYRQKLDQYK